MTTAAQADAERSTPRVLRGWWLVANAALPPLAWLVHIAAMPALVPLSCDTESTWFLHLTTVATAIVAAAGLVGSHRSWHEVARQRTADAEDPLEDPRGEVLDRARIWSTLGVVNGWLFLVLILAEHLPVLVVEPCPP